MVNPPKAPVLTSHAPVRPFVKTVTTPFSSVPDVTLFSVPAGKRLVIENVSAFTHGGFLSTHALLGFRLFRLANTGRVAEYIIPTNRLDPTPNANPGQQVFAQSLASVRWYAEGGESLVLEFVKNATFSSSTTITISGYLVDLP